MVLPIQAPAVQNENSGSTQGSTTESSKFIDENGELKTLSKDELSNLSIDSQLVYVFLMASELSDDELQNMLNNSFAGGNPDSIADYNNDIAYSNEMFREASDAGIEAGDDGTTVASDALVQYGIDNGVKIVPGKEYTSEEWDVIKTEVQSVQTDLNFKADLLGYDLERKLSDAATISQLTTKVMSAIQSFREKQAGALSFR